MRRPPLVLMAALLLAAGLAPAASALPTDTTAPPSSDGSSESSSSSSSSSSSTLPEPPVPTFIYAPAQGPPGTAVNIRSDETCPPPAGAGDPTVGVALFPFDPPSSEPVATDYFQIDGDGSWSGTLTVPTGVKPGRHVLVAVCFPSFEVEAEPYLIYQPEPFTITKAPTTTTEPPDGNAPPATPQPGDPNFVG